ncbi:MAG: DUF5107 domain-containing protein [Ruminococcaceae bacterium]|nr:DUF5107 domain-containing protein [Oscillospiraceae bacterium]
MESDCGFHYNYCIIIFMIRQSKGRKKMNKVEVSVEKLVLPTYAEPKAEEFPMFAENRVHQRTSGDPYPNKIVARVDRVNKTDKEYIAVRLENEYVRVVILPEIGGRIYGATDKITGYDFFYKQNVIKPALIGVLGSWISGGVEFNWPFHHRASGYMACDFDVEELEDGSAVCHLSEHDPIDRMKGMFSIVLRPGESFFETRMRLYNRTDMPHSFLWWENAAVPVNESYQIFFPQDVTYVNFHYLKSRITFPVAGNGVFNGIPMKEARDISYHKNTKEATSYFASASDYDFFGGYDHGKECGVVHIGDHHLSPGKKMFTWAYSQLSKSWENALTDTDGQYAELMAGSYSDNQPDFSWLAPYETKEFSQYWYPIAKIGTPTFANLNCAFKISREQGGATLSVQSCRVYKNATVKVYDGEKTCFEDRVDLCPEKPISLSLSSVPPYVTVELLDCEGECIAEYTEQSFDTHNMPPVITDMPLATEMRSAQELYLAGVHVEQYRDPAVHPDAYWKRALEREPDHIPSLIAMAKYEYRAYRFDSARKYAEEGLLHLCRYNKHPISGEAYYVLGQILEAQGEEKRAYDSYYSAAFAADFVAPAMTRIAVIDLKKRDFAAAKKHASVALDYGKNNGLARAAYVLALKGLGQNERAQALCKTYLREDPLDHFLRYLSGDVHFYEKLLSDSRQTCLDLCADLEAMGMYAEAKKLLKGLIDHMHGKGYRMIYCAIGYYSALCGEDPGFAYDAAGSAELGPAFPVRICEMRMLRACIETCDAAWARVLLGCLLYHKRHYREAAELWEACGDDPMAQRNLAVAYFSHLSRKEDALSLMRDLIDRYPTDETLLYEAVVLMNKMNRPAKEKIDLLLSRTFTRDDITVELSKAYNQAGLPEKAIETLMSHSFVPCEGGEHSIADQYLFAYLTKGKRALDGGEYSEALKLFEEGQKLPQSLGAGIWNHCKLIPLRYHCALALEALGRTDEAREIYRYICGTEIEYFSNMHLPELPFYQALSYDRLGDTLAARSLITEYKRTWSSIKDKTDNGFFGTTPFFMPFVDTASDLRRSYGLYLEGLLALYSGEKEAAKKMLDASYALNNDRLFALFYA